MTMTMTMTMLASIGLALGEAEWAIPSMDGASVWTYGGLAVLVVWLIGTAKWLLKGPVWLTGETHAGTSLSVPKEILWSFGISLLIGISVKALGWSYNDISWPKHAFGILGAIVATKFFHDGMTSPLGKVIAGFLEKTVERKDGGKP